MLRRKIVILIGCLIVVGVLVYVNFIQSPVYAKVHIELGEDVEVEQFLRHKRRDIAYQKALTDEEIHQIGTHTVKLLVNGKEYESELIVEDTTPPNAKVHEVTTYIKHELTADQFVSSIQDESKVTCSFEEEIDFTELGEHIVTIHLVDEGENRTSFNTTLTILDDQEPPVITGVKNITVPKGYTVAYKKDVKVSDNVDHDLKLDVDASTVNLNKIGSYPDIYSATDIAGNSTEKKATIKVVKPSAIKVTDELLNETADKILNEILKDGMSKRQKCKAIYRWVRYHIRWVGTSTKGNWRKGAWHAFTVRSGDCYTYFCASKVLLTRAGIKNFDLSASTNAHHYWNFVYVEGGWYHFDAAPRADKAYLCLRTDAWITNYSKKHRLGYKWDQKNKPKSATK